MNATNHKPTTAPRVRTAAGKVSALLCSLLLPVAASAAPGKPGASNNNKDIPVDVVLDDSHTTLTGTPSGPVNGVTSDGGSYPDSNSIQAFVGRNFGIWLYLGGSGRTLSIDLSQPLGGAGSVPVDLVTDQVDPNGVSIVSTSPDGVCDYCYQDPQNPAPLRPQPPSNVTVDAERFEIAAGVDLDDLLVGCSVETNARLRFLDSAGNDWRLSWGPRQIPGGYVPNPRSDPVLLKRTDQATIGGQTISGNFWFFQTTGDHLATLFRRESPQAGGYFEYYGQFKVPYSGYVQAQSYNPDLVGDHCDLRIPNLGQGLAPSTVSLALDPQNSNLLVATAVDQCDDFSAAPTSFDWWVDGTEIATGTGNTFDLSGYPDATITVFATHPDWLAKLPNLTTILQADVEGTAQYVLGGGGGEAMSVAPLAWSFPRGGKDVQVVITIVDSSGQPVPGVDVAGTLDGPSGPFPISGTTDGSGQVSNRVNNALDGQWCVNHLDVQDPGATYTWDGAPPPLNSNCATKN